MGATGTATLDFGAYPGKYDASVAVTGQAAIVSGSLVEAWIRPIATTEHSADEHILSLIAGLKVIAGNIQAGTGFTIYGIVDNPQGSVSNDGQYRNKPSKAPRMYGTFTIAWAWL